MCSLDTRFTAYAPRYHAMPFPGSVSQETVESDRNTSTESPPHTHDTLKIDEEAFKDGIKPLYSPNSWFTSHLPRWDSFSSSNYTLYEPAITLLKNHPTAWLSGLHGVACLLVVSLHQSHLWYPLLNHGWGSGPDNYHFVQLPIIRILYASGSAMVAIFFIVSGFSLSYKPLGLIRARHFPELLDCLSSSVFRRQLRLVLPPAAITFVTILASYAGLFGSSPQKPPLEETFGGSLLLWVKSVVELGDSFRPFIFPYGYNPIYDTVLWTIPAEMYGSMVVFITVLDISKLRDQSGWGYCGVLLAELNHIREDRAKTQRETALPDPDFFDLDQPQAAEKVHLNQEHQSSSLSFKMFWIFNLLLALFVCTMPLFEHHAEDSPGYQTLVWLIPSHYRTVYVQETFWIFIPAFHLFLTIDNARFLQIAFTNQLAQYLGKISFALYIIHNNLLHSLGFNLAEKALDWTGREPGLQYASGIFLTLLLFYTVMFWTADNVARHIDARSVRFGHWLWAKASIAA